MDRRTPDIASDGRDDARLGMDARDCAVLAAARDHDAILVIGNGTAAGAAGARLRQAGYLALCLDGPLDGARLRSIGPVAVVAVDAMPADIDIARDAGLPICAIGAGVEHLVPGPDAPAFADRRLQVMTGARTHDLLQGVFSTGSVLVDTTCDPDLAGTDWECLWRSARGTAALVVHEQERVVGCQFRPEHSSTTFGRRLLANFAAHYGGARPTWTAARWLADAREQMIGEARGLPAVVVTDASARGVGCAALALRALPAGHVTILQVAGTLEDPVETTLTTDLLEAAGAVTTELVEPPLGGDPARELGAALRQHVANGSVVFDPSGLVSGPLPAGAVRRSRPLASLTARELHELAAHAGIDVRGLRTDHPRAALGAAPDAGSLQQRVRDIAAAEAHAGTGASASLVPSGSGGSTVPQ